MRIREPLHPTTLPYGYASGAGTIGGVAVIPPSLHLRRDSPIPPFMQLKSQFEYEVVTGHIPPGGKLPSVRKVAKALETSPVTVIRAYRELEMAGLIVSQPGAGFFVLTADDSRTGPHARVRQLAAAFVEDSLNEGISLEQALQIFVAEINQAWAKAANLGLLVICKREDRSDELAMHLRQSLLDLRVEVTTAALEDVAADLAGWLPSLRKARFVLCNAFHLRELRALLVPHSIAIIPILGTLRDDVQQRLIHLPAGTKIGVLASSAEFVDGMMSAVLSLNPTVSIVGGLASDDVTEVPELLASVDCVVHGTLTRRALSEYQPMAADAIELVYVPEDGWIERLRNLIKSELGA